MSGLALVAVLGWLGSAVAEAGPTASVAEACRGVPEAESILAVLLSAPAVLRVEAIAAGDRADDPTVAPGEGARVVVPEQAFVDAPWLQRAVDCHLARNAAYGPPATGPRSPIDVPGARVIVGADGATLAISITTRDRVAAREILARARALARPR
jgi:hypothetical protein